MTDRETGEGDGGAEHTLSPTPTPLWDTQIDVVLERSFVNERQVCKEDLNRLVRWVNKRFEKESLAAQREALAQKQLEREAAKREKRAAARKDQEKRDRFKPLLFIAVTLGAWWLIIRLANLVITCVPGGGKPCGIAEPLIPSTNMSRPEWVLILISVIAALWVSKMMVYPNRDFEDQ